MSRYTLGPLMSSRRALLKDGETLGHFDISLPVEECERIVRLLNFGAAITRGDTSVYWRREIIDIMRGAI